MKLIGLTGSIGTGKSCVSTILKNEYNIEIIDADAISKKVVSKGSEGLLKIEEAFGKEYIDINGELDRKKLANLVFSNKDKRLELNSIIHPEVIKELKHIVEKCKIRGDKYVVFDCPLLIEEKLTSMVDIVLLIYTDRKKQIERIMLRDNMSKQEALARINSQMDQDEKKQYADVIIENNGSIIELEENIKSLYSNGFIYK